MVGKSEAQTGAPSVVVTDKRKKNDGSVNAPDLGKRKKVEVTRADPASLLLEKVFQFILDQPEFYNILSLPRPERKQLAKAYGSHISKMMTTFPHFNKVNTNG